MTTKSNTYSEILRSSSIIGGGKAINYLCSMLRIKVVALLLGPTGVGLIGLYYNATHIVGVVSSMGISSSGCREVARDYASGNTAAVAATVTVLRRSCWVTGILGWGLTSVLSWPLSVWVFGSSERAWAITILGCTLLLKAVSEGQVALIGGMRRMGDLARIDILSVIVSTFIALSLYAWLGKDGIVPVIVATAAVNLFSSWFYARRIPIEKIQMDWQQTYKHSKRFLGLGSAFVWSALLASLVTLSINGLIVRELGLNANGIFQAASALSILFANFVLGAMAADFYPRLSAVAEDSRKLNQAVNEQTEIGVLLVLPGLIGTLIYAPWVMSFFYSAAFARGAELLPWLIVSVLFKIVSWPLGYALIAKGESRWFAISETIFPLLHFAMAYILVHSQGLVGASMSFALLYIFHTIGMLFLLHRLTKFRWTLSVVRLMFIACTFLLGGLVCLWLPMLYRFLAGAALTIFSGIFCIRGIASRLGPQNRLVKMLTRLPWGKLLSGV